ncbi:hypothetical protein TNCV_2946721 [Trichonephila clavipes]|nr:hypothetical protein TNCV_2946721 [Trichonephila clavipes]
MKAMKTSSVELISAHYPLPMNSKHHRFVMFFRRDLPALAVETKEKEKYRLNRRPEPLQRKISMRSTKDQTC